MKTYLGLGSNEGDRLAHLRDARDALARSEGIEVLRASSVYETEPQGEAAGRDGDFLNACLEVETGLGPEELLEACKAVELELGREPGGPRHAPRTIDVDVLLVGDVRHRSERIEVPHPDLEARRFAIAPLLELDPELRLPDGRPLADCLPATEGQRVERLDTLG